MEWEKFEQIGHWAKIVYPKETVGDTTFEEKCLIIAPMSNDEHIAMYGEDNPDEDWYEPGWNCMMDEEAEELLMIQDILEETEEWYKALKAHAIGSEYDWPLAILLLLFYVVIAWSVMEWTGRIPCLINCP